MSEIIKGSVVYLKSGSPALSVSNITKNTVYVTWLSEKQAVQAASFPIECVTTIKPVL